MGFDVNDAITKVADKAEEIAKSDQVKDVIQKVEDFAKSEKVQGVIQKVEDFAKSEQVQDTLQKAGSKVSKFVQDNKDLPEDVIDKARDLIEKAGINLPK